jgi:glucose-1-phosphate thymidylyltransferase
MKGIILAGGNGSRLFPLTVGVSKQLLPVYDKPMIYYPLSMLMLAGISDVLLICEESQLPLYNKLLKNGHQWGINIEYKIQQDPNGLAEAFLIGKNFIENNPVCLILGDNIFYGHGLPEKLRSAAKISDGAQVFAYKVNDPTRYGVIEFDISGKAISIEEKPKDPKSDFAIPGIYFYDQHVVEFAEKLLPSTRGELEITDLNQMYLEKGKLNVEELGRGVAWLDAGLPDSLMSASAFIQTIQKRQGLMISCPEEISYRIGNINLNQLIHLTEQMGDNNYRKYLLNLVKTESD